MVVVGPRPFGKGLWLLLNDVALSDIPVIGPSKMGAQLEGSKNLQENFNQTQHSNYDSFTAKP
jgi:phosphoribosylamine--glycine ligase